MNILITYLYLFRLDEIRQNNCPNKLTDSNIIQNTDQVFQICFPNVFIAVFGTLLKESGVLHLEYFSCFKLFLLIACCSCHL